MKKLLLLASFICLFAVSSQAQYQKGDFILSAGLGVGYYYAGGGASLLINGEYFVLDKLSIGGYFGYTSWNYGVGNDYKLNFIDFGARGSYHFSELFGITNENLDIYGGAQLGYLVSSWSGPGGSFLDDAGYGGGVRAGIHAGARYFFTPKFGAYGEIGAGYSPLAFGVTFKF